MDHSQEENQRWLSLLPGFETEAEENRVWLSLLPLFETDHWPVVRYDGPRLFHATTTDNFLMHCICGERSHALVCVFPYARYGHRTAWYVMEETMVSLVEHYEDDVLEEIEQELTSSWPWFFSQIYHQTWEFYNQLWCLYQIHGDWDGCDDTPYMYPYWSPDEAQYEHCQCSGTRTPTESSLDSDADERFWAERERQEQLLLEDGSSIELGFHGQVKRSNGVLRQTGVVISEYYAWEYQVVGDSQEIDDPPSYDTVSELPAYEHPPVYQDSWNDFPYSEFLPNPNVRRR